MRFAYKAETKEGKIIKGFLETVSKQQALALLEKYGFYVVSLNEVKLKGVSPFGGLFFGKIPKKDFMSLARRLAVMLKSGIAIDEALRIQVAQVSNSNLRSVLLGMAEAVESGSSLSQALSLYPKVFNSFYISCVKSGEASGKIDDALSYLADHLEKEYALRAKIRGAMVYPAFIVFVFIAIFFVLGTFVMPKLMVVLKAFGGKLPAQTKFLISLVGFMSRGGWIIVLAFLIALGALVMFFKKSKKGKNIWGAFVLKVPLLRDFYKKVYLTQFCESLSVLIKAGVPITQALQITRDVIDNVPYKEIIEKIRKRVFRGENISSVLGDYPKLVPPFLTQMVFTGEKTGHLEDTLMEVVKFYQAETDRMINSFVKLLEPILILVLGVVVAILAVGVLFPIFRAGFSGLGS
ncbi:type II secretion system F family protein [bacterium]|nr:type II secretion system F family protein [bacterium]